MKGRRRRRKIRRGRGKLDFKQSGGGKKGVSDGRGKRHDMMRSGIPRRQFYLLTTCSSFLCEGGLNQALVKDDQEKGS